MRKITKRQLADDIVYLMNWFKENKDILSRDQQERFYKAVEDVTGYENDGLKKNSIMRHKKDKIQQIHHDAIEAIY